MFYIRGGGNGHGIGMSQYGAYGYALHGKDYRWILAHYYQGTALGQTDPSRIVRVLLATGPVSFSGATRAGSTVAGARHDLHGPRQRRPLARLTGVRDCDNKICHNPTGPLTSRAGTADGLRAGTAECRRARPLSRLAPVSPRRSGRDRDDQRRRTR